MDLEQQVFQHRIQSAAKRNTQLLQILAETDYVVSAQQQNADYINALKKQIAEEELEVKSLGLNVEKEYEDYEKYRESSLKRFAYRFGGQGDKFDAKATKEEKEWLDAVKEELKAKNELQKLKLDLVKAEETSAELAETAIVHDSAQIELDELYNSIFQGYTPDVPGEDEKEAALTLAEHKFNALQLDLCEESQAASFLRDAGAVMMKALDALRDAMAVTNTELNPTHNHRARVYMRESASYVIRCDALVGYAHNHQPLVMPALRPARGWDNTNMQTIPRNSFDSLKEAQKRLVAEMYATDEREVKLQAKLDEAKVDLIKKRRELQEIRKMAFQNIPGLRHAPHSADVPPHYEGGNPPTYAA